MADEDRIVQLEHEVSALHERINALEERLATPPPPPVQVPPPYIPYGSYQRPPTPRYRPPSEPRPKPPSSPEAEYKIGAQVLPRVGAAVFLIGVLYLVGLAISRGYIMPTTQFVGEQILCAAFVVLGLIKRNEREDFGQVLVGIGSCGFYLSFAGANAFKHVISDEQLIALFVLLALPISRSARGDLRAPSSRSV